MMFIIPNKDAGVATSNILQVHLPVFISRRLHYTHRRLMFEMHVLIFSHHFIRIIFSHLQQCSECIALPISGCEIIDVFLPLAQAN